MKIEFRKADTADAELLIEIITLRFIVIISDTANALRTEEP